MDEKTAREILGDDVFTDYCVGCNSPDHWYTLQNDESIEMRGEFTANELEAIAWWMRHKGEKES